MDFFGAQDAARRQTAWLVLLFALAAIGLVVITSLFIHFVFGLFGGTLSVSHLQEGGLLGRIDWPAFAGIALVVALIVAGGSLYKVLILSRGGAAVAEALGGRLLAPDSEDPEARRVLNVVVEMAIASGTPVPSVYLLAHEAGINAFAAGLTPADAAIGLTQGAVTHLNRDQLQGVIAHEFSHIVNGDMRLNLRLAGLLHGILLIGLIGRVLVQAGGRGGGGKSRDRAAFAALGLGLMVTGFTGTLFANLIKASVSRQREFLADAAAVQFTRNPQGIAGALKRIGAASVHGLLSHPRAPEMSHAYFATGVRTFLGRLSATHPPLELRIRRLDPRWNGRFEEVPRPGEQEDGAGAGAVSAPLADVAGASRVSIPLAENAGANRVSTPFGMSPKGTPATTPDMRPEVTPDITSEGLQDAVQGAIDQIGQPDETHLRHAQSLIGELPATLRWAAREPYGAQALVFALLLDGDVAIRQRQLAHLETHLETGLGAETLRLWPSVLATAREFRLPLVDLSLPALRQLSAPQAETFRTALSALIAADGRVRLFEWCLSRILLAGLEPGRGNRRAGLAGSSAGGQMDCPQLVGDCALILTLVARLQEERMAEEMDEKPGAGAGAGAGAKEKDKEAKEADEKRGMEKDVEKKVKETEKDIPKEKGMEMASIQAFRLGIARLGLPEGTSMDMAPLDHLRLDASLQQLRQLKPQAKRDLLQACAAAILLDANVSPAELEVLRAIGAALDCPIPPLAIPIPPLAIP